jgi:4-hydroxy-3-methylbut-2-enyl diphosphate reductase IspH
VLELRRRPRFGVMAQTTQPIDRVRELVRLMRRRFPDSELRFVDTVCQPTKQRQHAAIELAQQCDAVVVIGGAHSNNTRELVNTCSRHCPQVYHVQTAADLRPEWIADCETVGITAGTSTPDHVIAGVESRLQEMAGAAGATVSPPLHPETEGRLTPHFAGTAPGGESSLVPAKEKTARTWPGRNPSSSGLSSESPALR